MKFSSPATLLNLITIASAATIDVKVGSGGLNFQPDSFTANEGDSVVFHFYSGSGSHSVALSSFDNPCQPASGGFYSGTIMGNQAGDHTFTILVTSTTPSWIYCSVGSHCQNGMVAVMNPPSSSSQTIEAFASAAMNVMRESSPAEIQGGVVATGGVSGASSSTSEGGMTPASPRPSLVASSESGSVSASSSMAMTTTGSGGAAGASTSSTSSAGAGGAGATTSSSRASTPSTSSPSVAATTTSGGRKSEWSVVLGLTVVVGGLVALMS